MENNATPLITRSYGQWSKNRFAETTRVAGQGHDLLFLSGIGAEDAVTGQTRHPGDFQAQYVYSWERIQQILAEHGAGLADIVRVTTYVTSHESRRTVHEVRSTLFEGLDLLPSSTFLVINGFAWPDMLCETDIVAAVQHHA